ncbi:DNA transporter [Desulfopila sp. IMCC35006]|uniref:LOG family protein n=1 Tax=Desulfopila sp. IMCC35006 TaxID=2569542 RepID=UPI0010AD4903|nr:LOG family protein [Desulfopila sp. IMCC35006]TKB24022.1 DNA transporter [Desulfopila sp. IMCC35006]
MKIEQIISPDGYISDIPGKVDGTDILQARFSFPDVSDYIRGAIREEKPFIFSGRSGNAQIGIKTDLLSPKTVPVVDGMDVHLDGKLQNLNPLLGDAVKLFKIGDEIGRLVVMDPELRIHDVRHYLHKRLFVGRENSLGHYDGFEIKQETDPVTGKQSDYILADLEPYQYCFEPGALNESSINDVIKKGRLALAKIRSRTSLQLDQAMLEPGGLFIGAIKISLGDIYGIIDAVTAPADQDIVHLPARVLDPFRTFRDRQVELYHFGKTPVPLNRVRVIIRFFRAKNPLTVPLIKNKVKDGYRLFDLLTNAEVSNLFQFVDEMSLGMILNKNNFIQIASAIDPQGQAQLEIIKNAVVESTARKPKQSCLIGENGEFTKTLEKLSVLGGINSRVFIADTFPSSEVIDVLRTSGVRTFLINTDNPSFEDDYVKKMIKLTHAVSSDCEFLRYDAETDKLYTFYHGCFIEPDDRERFDVVRYWFAFYGSHTKEADNQLTIDLINKLALKFGSQMGIVHGGGPGLMKEANDLAREHNIMSVGVAIDLEGEHQLSLTTCDGLIKYREGLRLARQDHLQKLSNLPIINTGGYGSAEELSITITSMKLHENPLAPVILLDPDNLWAEMQAQITEIARNNYGPQFIPHLVKSCRNGEDALSELVRFCLDPDAWYLENNIPEHSIQTARGKSRRIRAETLYQGYVEVFDSPNPRLAD